MTGRTFTASLKPSWNQEQIEEFLLTMQGSATVFIINHDKDINDMGEPVESHTHIYLDYPTPRKITTVSNLLGVEPNFVELVKNKKGFLRYLTHKDEETKHKYNDDEVYTNSSVSYTATLLGSQLSDKEIAEYLIQGRGLELLGVVSSSKLRTIQSFLHFDSTNQQTQMIRTLNAKIDAMSESLETVASIAVGFSTALDLSVKDLTNGFKLIAEEIKKARLRVR